MFTVLITVSDLNFLVVLVERILLQVVISHLLDLLCRRWYRVRLAQFLACVCAIVALGLLPSSSGFVDQDTLPVLISWTGHWITLIR